MNPGIVFLAALVLFIGAIILLCVVEIHRIDARLCADARKEKNNQALTDAAKRCLRMYDMKKQEAQGGRMTNRIWAIYLFETLLKDNAGKKKVVIRHKNWEVDFEAALEALRKEPTLFDKFTKVQIDHAVKDWQDEQDELRLLHEHGIRGDNYTNWFDATAQTGMTAEATLENIVGKLNKIIKRLKFKN